ncbi:hypothetical protein [Acinetobacter modestus]|uniref:hypothetical protein n=1 Tax=Acinetobacter modestus TaxID=1776740 RepID=UPI003018A247
MENKQLIPIEPQQCPVQMPVSYFGASYPDSQCIEGYLWDEDSGDGEGLTSGGDIPCPFCNPNDHADYMKEYDGDEFVCEACDTKLEKLHWVETEKPSVKLYGHCPKCNCNQWAGYKEAKADAEEN